MSINAKNGFTLIELVVVILLLAIVATVAATRLTGRQSYEIFSLQELAISVVRQVQVNSMQSNIEVAGTNNNFTLNVSSDCIGSVAACNNSADDGRSDLITADDYQFQLNRNGVAATNSAVSFDLLGNPQGVTPIEIVITSSVNSESGSVCINEQGYVFATNGGCA